MCVRTYVMQYTVQSSTGVPPGHTTVLSAELVNVSIDSPMFLKLDDASSAQLRERVLNFVQQLGSMERRTRPKGVFVRMCHPLQIDLNHKAHSGPIRQEAGVQIGDLIR